MKRKMGFIITISFKPKETQLIEWVDGQADKKYLKLGSFSAVVKRCIEICRDKDLIVKESENEKSVV